MNLTIMKTLIKLRFVSPNLKAVRSFA